MNPASSSPVQTLPLPCRFGRYRLVELLATGGMAQVYRAKSFGAEGFVKQLVIKRLDPRLAAKRSYTDLFVNEAKLLVTLNHGNIVPVFDFGRAGDDLYIAMEYVRGTSVHGLLQALRAEDRRLEPELAAFIAAEVCKGLDYAHHKADPTGGAAGIVHRDVKPQNILVSEEGEVKIVDFGVAKLASRVEGTSSLVGTLSYMAPEQAERDVVDPRTDLFSLGLVLYELITRERAYSATSAEEMLRFARSASLPVLPDSIPSQLRAVVQRATARDPERRYASAHEMEQDLAEYLLVARSASEVVDPTLGPPRARLGELVRKIASPESDPVESPEALTDIVDQPEPVPGPIPELDASPPDLALIRDAAETFHSEFLTRVLKEAAAPMPASRWPVVVAVALLALTGIVLALTLRRTDPRRTAMAGDARPVSRDPLPSSRPVDPSSHPASAPASAPTEDLPPRMVPPRKRPRGGFGYLSLNSLPWSLVTIGHAATEHPTPILRLKLPAGRHTIVLENREQRLRKVLSVWIRRGATTTRLVKLK